MHYCTPLPTLTANVATTSASHSAIWERYGDRAIDGDRSAIGGLLETYRPLLMVIANRSLSASLKTKVGASDLVQQTCEDAFVGITQVRAQNGGQLWGWLSSLLSKNVCDVQRRYVLSQKRALCREEQQCNGTGFDPSIEIPVDLESIQAELVQQLNFAMERLPRAHQEVLRLRFLESRSCEEIGQLVSRSEDAVRMMVGRSLKRLQRELPGNNSAS